jgi:hypothetical protein
MGMNEKIDGKNNRNLLFMNFYLAKGKRKVWVTFKFSKQKRLFLSLK